MSKKARLRALVGLVLVIATCLITPLLTNRPRILPKNNLPERDIVFAVAGTNQLGFINADGTGYVKRTIFMGWVHPFIAGSTTRWSQDGNYLVTRHNNEIGGNPNPGDPLLISLDGNFLSCPEFHGQGDVWGVGGTRVVVSDEGTKEVYLVDIATCQRLETLYSNTSHIQSPAISSQGQLALEDTLGLVIIDMAGREVFRDRNGLNPAWSGDGEWLAYDVDGGGIDIIRKDGSDQRQIVESGVVPSWSPDGQWLVYVGSSLTNEDANAILKINVETGKIVQLFEGGHLPSWRWHEDE